MCRLSSHPFKSLGEIMQTQTAVDTTIGSYRIRAVPPQQFELQQKRPSGDWRGISWCTSFEAAGAVLLRRAMAEQSIECLTIDDLIFAVEQAKASVIEMLKIEMRAGNQT